LRVVVVVVVVIVVAEYAIFVVVVGVDKVVGIESLFDKKITSFLFLVTS